MPKRTHSWPSVSFRETITIPVKDSYHYTRNIDLSVGRSEGHLYLDSEHVSLVHLSIGMFTFLWPVVFIHYYHTISRESAVRYQVNPDISWNCTYGRVEESGVRLALPRT